MMWMDGEIQSKPINEVFYKHHRLKIFIYILSVILSLTAETCGNSAITGL